MNAAHFFTMLDGEQTIAECASQADAMAAALTFFMTDPLSHTVTFIDVTDANGDVVETLDRKQSCGTWSIPNRA